MMFGGDDMKLELIGRTACGDSVFNLLDLNLRTAI
jgi:hypothetical protein